MNELKKRESTPCYKNFFNNNQRFAIHKQPAFILVNCISFLKLSHYKNDLLGYL